MKKLLLISAFILVLSGCASLTGAQKSTVDTKQCTTHFIWDETLKTNRITHETCNYFNSKSSREYPNGILVEGNRTTGQFKVDTGNVKNADETTLQQALGEILVQPGVIQALINLTKGDL